MSRATFVDGIRLQGRSADDLRPHRRERVGDRAAGRLGSDLRTCISSRTLLSREHATQLSHRRQRQTANYGIRSHVY